VAEHTADYGVALDGDADRLQMVDAAGRCYDGDELMFAVVADRLARGERVPGVVGTLMTNMAVEQALKARGVALVRAKVGDRYVLEELLARGWQVGGENSGHLLVLDRHTTGDGIISALQVLQAVRRTGKSLSGLLDGVQLFPQVMINVRLAVRSDWQQNATLVGEKARVEDELGQQGRVLIRASGTEPVLRVMVEARDRASAQGFAERLAQAAQAA
jgi:phosphoglucosamine mutase